MDLTPHLVTRGAIGACVKRPIAVLILAFAGHFVLDALPHFDIAGIGDKGLLRGIDVRLGPLLTRGIAWKAKRLWPLAGAPAAVLADPPGLKERVDATYGGIFPHGVWAPLRGVLPEIVVTAGALAWALGAAP